MPIRSKARAAPDTRTRDYARRRAADLLNRVAREMRKTAKNAGPDEVHDVRVAIRRFSACLRVFREFFPRGRTARLRRQLKRVLHRAGEVRNRDIAIPLLEEAGLGEQTPAHAALRKQRARKEKALRKAAGRWKRPDLSGMPGKDPLPDHAATAGFARAFLPDAAAKYFDLVRQTLDGEPSPASLHRLRLKGKRLRYTIELFDAVYPAGVDGILGFLATSQRLLGEVNDCAATADLVSGELPARAREKKSLGAFLARRARTRTAELRRHWQGGGGLAAREKSWRETLQAPRPAPGQGRRRVAALN